MSRLLVACVAPWTRVPRASGDEPGLKKKEKIANECSPRERG